MTNHASDRFSNLPQPKYQRSALKSRIVHLGFGAFHRAHQALFTHEMLEKTQSDWGICEVNLFGGEELITQLREQSHLYTVAEKGAQSTEVKLIGSVTESLHPALDGKHAVLSKMTEEQVAIVSMTITEKGYCADPATGRLDKSNSLIQQDIATPQSPSSAIGYIVEALRLRREAGLKPFSPYCLVITFRRTATSHALQYWTLPTWSTSNWPVGLRLTLASLAPWSTALCQLRPLKPCKKLPRWLDTTTLAVSPASLSVNGLLKTTL